MEHFLDTYAARYRKQITGFEEEAVAAILGYDWPGNIRELENVIERGVIMARDGDPLRLHHLFGGGEVLGPPAFRVGPEGRVADRAEAPGPDEALAALMAAGMDLAGLERRMIDQALARAGGNKSRAAAALGITRAQLYYRLKEQGQ